MLLVDDVQKALEEMRESPVRHILSEGKMLPCNLSDKIFDEMNKLPSELDTLRQDLEKPLNIVFMGDIKSGKSTLLNAIIGGKVSPVDVLEATGVIIEVGYGEKDRGVISFRDGSTKDGNIGEIHDILNKHQQDEDFTSKVQGVSIYSSLERCRHYRMVDTPGLTTLTTKNVETTHNYIPKMDVILWVLNANHLGDIDVVNEIREISTYGKPMVCVLSHIDEIGEVPQEAIEFVKTKEYSFYFDKILAVSAKEALDGVLSGDVERVGKSGIRSLEDTLASIGNTEGAAQKTKLDSSRSSLRSILAREKSNHSVLLFDITASEKELLKIERDIGHYRQTINRKAEDLALSFIENELFEKEFRNIEETIRSMPSVDKDVIEAKLSAEIDEECLNGYAMCIKNRLDAKLRDEWMEAMEIISHKISEDMRSYYDRRAKILGDDEDSIAMNKRISLQLQDLQGKFDFKENLKKDMIVAGGAGVGLAAYAAWLGPYALITPFLPAVAAMVVPFASIALGVNVFRQVFRGKGTPPDKELVLCQVRKALDKMRSEIKRNFFEAVLLKKICKFNSEKAGELSEKFVSYVFNGWGKDEIEVFKADVERYVRNIL